MKEAFRTSFIRVLVVFDLYVSVDGHFSVAVFTYSVLVKFCFLCSIVKCDRQTERQTAKKLYAIGMVSQMMALRTRTIHAIIISLDCIYSCFETSWLDQLYSHLFTGN